MATIHATCVTVMGTGVLLRGKSGSGKTSIALNLMDMAAHHGDAVYLVSDDRVILENRHGVLYATAPKAIAGLIEMRGVGILRVNNLNEVKVGMVVDLIEAQHLDRLPDNKDRSVLLNDVALPRVMIVERNPDAAMIIRTTLRHGLESPFMG